MRTLEFVELYSVQLHKFCILSMFSKIKVSSILIPHFIYHSFMSPCMKIKIIITIKISKHQRF